MACIDFPMYPSSLVEFVQASKEVLHGYSVVLILPFDHVLDDSIGQRHPAVPSDTWMCSEDHNTKLTLESRIGRVDEPTGQHTEPDSVLCS